MHSRRHCFFFSIATALRVQSARWMWLSSPVSPRCCRVWCVYIAGLPLATRLFLLSADAGISAVYVRPSGLQDRSCGSVMVPASRRLSKLTALGKKKCWKSSVTYFTLSSPSSLTETLSGHIQMEPENISFPRTVDWHILCSVLLSSSASSLCCPFKLCVS